MCFRKILKLHKHEFGIVRNRSVISVNDSGQRSLFSVNERTNQTNERTIDANERTNERMTQTNARTNERTNQTNERTNERKTISKRTENEERTKHLLSYTNQGLYHDTRHCVSSDNFIWVLVQLIFFEIYFYLVTFTDY